MTDIKGVSAVVFCHPPAQGQKGSAESLAQVINNYGDALYSPGRRLEASEPTIVVQLHQSGRSFYLGATMDAFLRSKAHIVYLENGQKRQIVLQMDDYQSDDYFGRRNEYCAWLRILEPPDAKFSQALDLVDQGIYLAKQQKDSQAQLIILENLRLVIETADQ